MNEPGIDWNNALTMSDMNKPEPKRSQAAVDVEISRIVGQRILTNDPRLIRFVAQWKKQRGRSENEEEHMDFYIRDEAFKKAIIKSFND